ncbi:hypothetical protein OF83DRAFT_194790 [Amylostereum chailletii]|nr:hypothetical protein OF83DRAFT_194790 [Amylostereum chailletii]
MFVTRDILIPRVTKLEAPHEDTNGRGNRRGTGETVPTWRPTAGPSRIRTSLFSFSARSPTPRSPPSAPGACSPRPPPPVCRRSSPRSAPVSPSPISIQVCSHWPSSDRPTFDVLGRRPWQVSPRARARWNTSLVLAVGARRRRMGRAGIPSHGSGVRTSKCQWTPLAISVLDPSRTTDVTRLSSASAASIAKRQPYRHHRRPAMSRGLERAGGSSRQCKYGGSSRSLILIQRQRWQPKRARDPGNARTNERARGLSFPGDGPGRTIGDRRSTSLRAGSISNSGGEVSHFRVRD